MNIIATFVFPRILKIFYTNLGLCTYNKSLGKYSSATMLLRRSLVGNKMVLDLYGSVRVLEFPCASPFHSRKFYFLFINKKCMSQIPPDII